MTVRFQPGRTSYGRSVFYWSWTIRNQSLLLVLQIPTMKEPRSCLKCNLIFEPTRYNIVTKCLEIGLSLYQTRFSLQTVRTVSTYQISLVQRVTNNWPVALNKHCLEEGWRTTNPSIILLSATGILVTMLSFQKLWQMMSKYFADEQRTIYV